MTYNVILKDVSTLKNILHIVIRIHVQGCQGCCSHWAIGRRLCLIFWERYYFIKFKCADVKIYTVTYNLGTYIFSGIWQSLRSIFPDKVINSCAHHWAQEKEPGVATIVHGTWRHIQLSMQVVEVFTKLQEKASSEVLCSLCDYIYSTWIEST